MKYLRVIITSDDNGWLPNTDFYSIQSGSSSLKEVENLSKENVRLFFVTANIDEALGQKLEELTDVTEAEYIQHVITLGREYGLYFTKEDMQMLAIEIIQALTLYEDFLNDQLHVLADGGTKRTIEYHSKWVEEKLRQAPLS